MRPTIKRGQDKGTSGQLLGAQPNDQSRLPVTEIYLILELPPSTNKLYQKRRGGGLALSAEAKKYQRSVKRVMGEPRNVIRLSRFPISEDDVYELEVILYFPLLENPGWFEFWEKDTYVTRGKNKGQLKGKRGERKAKTRYKVIDYDNRIKFMQDCLASAIGINDCQIFRGVQEKREDLNNPRAEVCIRVIDSSAFLEEGR